MQYVSSFVVCHAVVNITVNPKSATNSSNYTTMFTPDGLTFPSSGDVQTLYIYISLSDQSADLLNMSIKIDNAINFNVVLIANNMQSKKVFKLFGSEFTFHFKVIKHQEMIIIKLFP